ncbi:hypothetical protein D3C78_1858210 [compost metagenome]
MRVGLGDFSCGMDDIIQHDDSSVPFRFVAARHLDGLVQIGGSVGANNIPWTHGSGYDHWFRAADS